MVQHAHRSIKAQEKRCAKVQFPSGISFFTVSVPGTQNNIFLKNRG